MTAFGAPQTMTGREPKLVRLPEDKGLSGYPTKAVEIRYDDRGNVRARLYKLDRRRRHAVDPDQYAVSIGVYVPDMHLPDLVAADCQRAKTLVIVGTGWPL